MSILSSPSVYGAQTVTFTWKGLLGAHLSGYSYTGFWQCNAGTLIRKELLLTLLSADTDIKQKDAVSRQ